MLKVDIDEGLGVVTLEPCDALTESDFSAAARIIDPYLLGSGEIKGIIIHLKSFPKWESFSALIAHLKFVRSHHQKIARVAFTTDSMIGNFSEVIGNHFVKAEIKHFDFSALDTAKQWIAGCHLD